MIKTGSFVIVYLLLATAGLYVNMHKDILVPATIPLREFPAVNGEWRQLNRAEFSKEILEVLKPTDYLSAKFKNAQGEVVELYL